MAYGDDQNSGQYCILRGGQLDPFLLVLDDANQPFFLVLVLVYDSGSPILKDRGPPARYKKQVNMLLDVGTGDQWSMAFIIDY